MKDKDVLVDTCNKCSNLKPKSVEDIPDEDYNQDEVTDTEN